MKIEVELSDEWYKKLQWIANQDERSIEAEVRYAIRYYFGQEAKDYFYTVGPVK